MRDQLKESMSSAAELTWVWHVSLTTQALGSLFLFSLVRSHIVDSISLMRQDETQVLCLSLLLEGSHYAKYPSTGRM